MAVDFSFLNIVDIIAQTLFSGNTTIAGLVIMLVCAFILMAILANIKAPMEYSMAPMLILAIIFGAMGIMDTTVSFVIIIISAIVVASGARRLISG